MAFEADGQGAAERPRPPVVPRRSASLLLVRDDPLRVLMLRRGSTRGAFPSALVFPGGVLEVEDGVAAVAHGHAEGDESAALRATAIRETWEEVGVLLARDPSERLLTGPQVPTPEAAGASGLGGVLGAAAARLALDDVVPFGRWITPVEGKRRFDTDFFIARAPDEQEPTADGVEAVALRWVEPSEVPSLTSEMLLLPTLMNLRRLGSFGSLAEAVEASPRLPRIAVTPTVGFDGAGNPVVRIPAEAGYGVTEFRPRDQGHFQFER